MPAGLALEDFDALSFDCYGTLIDWEQGIWDATARWRARTGQTCSPEELLEAFGSLESGAEASHPTLVYPEILALVMDGLGDGFGAAATGPEVAHFSASVGDWPPFADSADALQRLKSLYRLIILSNVDRRSFAASSARLDTTFDAVVTAEDVGSYKPDARNFQALISVVDEMGIAPGRLLHVAQSLFHDHVPAKGAGLSTAWIDRRAGQAGQGATPTPDVEVHPDFTYPSMQAFVAACERGYRRV